MRVTILFAIVSFLVVTGCKEETTGATCGDGVMEGPEVCDASSLGGETCFTRAGHLHGELACSADCGAFDTSDCHSCGNGVFEGPEQCEGVNIRGATCVSIGFDGGDLSCTTQCVYDTSLCFSLCGNGQLDAGEECDGGALDGASCQSVVSMFGTLACTENCTFDVSGCHPPTGCGDGTCDLAAGEDSVNCPADCDLPLCPPPGPDPDQICITGWAMHFLEPTGSQAFMSAPMADSQAAADATRVQVLVYDPLAYASNPATLPLAVAEVDPRTGAFVVTGVNVPATHFISLLVDDWSGSGADDFVLAGAFLPAQPGVNVEGRLTYGVLATQNTAWSTAIGDSALGAAWGCNPGDTLWDCGTWIGVFGYPDSSGLALIDGVVPLSGPTPPPQIPIGQVFFPNPGFASFTQPASLADSYTNQTGAVFVPGAQLGNYSGLCADVTPDSGCEAGSFEFETRLGGASPGVIMIQPMSPLGYQ